MGKDAPDFMIRAWRPARSLTEFMHEYFPWLEWDYLDSDEADEALGGEVKVHSLQVRLSDLGEQYVAVEEYCAEGLPEPEELQHLGRGEMEDDADIDEQ